jgi:hypothetical protein
VAIYWNNTKFYINERKKQNDGGFEGLLLWWSERKNSHKIRGHKYKY